MRPPLTRLEQDLSNYTQDKACKLILDVVQAFEIADRPRSDAIACIGSMLLRICATIAVECGADRQRWLMLCSEFFDKSQQAKKEDNDD